MQPGSRSHPLFVSTLALVSLCLSPLPATGDEVSTGVPRELHLVFVDLCDTAPQLRHGALRAIESLLEPTGLTVTGEMAPAARDRLAGGVYVVLMPFNPSLPRTQPVGGAAQSESGRQLTVWAFPPKVAGGLGLDLEHAARWTHRKRLQFQRALAVVVVHELAHALAGASHRSERLMSPQLRREQLLDPQLAVDADLYPALLAGVARLEP